MADKDLKQLIDSLKTEGIEAAEAEARTILAEAQQKAQTIEEAAHKRKIAILEEAQQEADDIVEKGQQALQQAARDLKLALRQEIIGLLDQVFKTEVRQNLTPDLIQSTIMPILENVGNEITVAVPQESVQELSEYLRQQLQQDTKEIQVLSSGPKSANIHIRHTSAGWTYEISPETISEALRPYLTQQWLDHLGESSENTIS